MRGLHASFYILLEKDSIMPTTLPHALLVRRNVFVGWLLLAVLAVLAVLAASVSQRVLASEPQAVLADAPVNNYYRIAASSSQYISAADDAASGAGPECTLRDALGIVNAGNTTGTINGCQIAAVGAPASHVYVINLPTGGYTYTLNGSQLDISANTVYLVGDSRDNTIIQANAAPNTATYRVLNVGSGATVEISDVTIRHGNAADGGGIFNSGNLFVNNSILSTNTAVHQGGGICNTGGAVTVKGGVFSGNSADGDSDFCGLGGGIANDSGTGGGASVTVTGVTFVGNSARALVDSECGGLGGGIQNWANDSVTATVTVSDSTFIYNFAGDWGGAIRSGTSAGVARVTLVNSTIFSNTVNNGGGSGIANEGGGLTLINSTIANNSGATGGLVQLPGNNLTPTLEIHNTLIANNGGGDCVVLWGGNLASGDHNIVPNNECNFAAGTSDPHLGPLADNGGSTLTMALLPGSPAINAGNPAYCPATDQRGTPRSPVCDIGAYEVQYTIFLPLIKR
jgi:hypothetical protein